MYIICKNVVSNPRKSIFGASEDDVRKLAEINDVPKDAEAPSQQEIKQPAGGLASAADLLKQEEDQFRQPSIQEQRANFKPDQKNLDKLKDLMNNRSGKKSLVEMKREMQQNVYGQKDKSKFEINPRPAPGSENSALPATRAVVVQETSLGDLTQPLAKR